MSQRHADGAHGALTDWPLRRPIPQGDGLDCQHAAHGRHMAAQDDHRVRDDPATSTTTDLRRARQKARSVVRDLLADIIVWVQRNNVRSMLSGAAGARRANLAVTDIASQRLREDLLAWLDERNRITMGRAARDANTKMSQALQVSQDRLVGDGTFDAQDREALRQIRQVDAGLLYDTQLADRLGLSEPLAEELGDDVTRQLRLGVDQDERVQDLAERVRAVVTDADVDNRTEMGVSGQTKRSKAELIAHDSVQDAHNAAARGRYLRNGFRYATYDATVDTKTTDLCLRMNEHVIDLRDDPFLVPPLHPYCRSGIRPILDVDRSDVVSREDIAEDYLGTIMQTKSYRPPTNAAGDFRPTALTRQFDQDGSGAASGAPN